MSIEDEKLFWKQISDVDSEYELNFDFLSIDVDIDESINRGKDHWSTEL